MAGEKWIAKVRVPAPCADGRFAICFSGGGSRALSCALGQLSALHAITDAAERPIIERIDYISAVSGGAWAASLYTYLPRSVRGRRISLHGFLIRPLEAGRLSRKGSAEQGNVTRMGPYCLGRVPQRFKDTKLIGLLLKYWIRGLFGISNRTNWFWIASVGELVLKPFGLYHGSYQWGRDRLRPRKGFSSTEQYVAGGISSFNPELGPDDFYLLQRKVPDLILNFNVMLSVVENGVLQLPVQVRAETTSVPGCYTSGCRIGNESLQTFAFGSRVLGSGPEPGTLAIEAGRFFSLCDAVGCSSAFYAVPLIQQLNRIVTKATAWLPGGKKMSSFLQNLLDSETDELVPQYSLVTSEETGSELFRCSDGGDFENTGLLGLLAQTRADRIVVFINSATPLQRKGSGVVVDRQLPLIFGMKGPDQSGAYQAFGAASEDEPLSFVQVLNNENDEFRTLTEELLNASANGNRTAAYLQELTTVANEVAGVEGGRKIKVLWVYNNRVNDWQKGIADPGLRKDLVRGQADQNDDGSPKNDSRAAAGPLAHFPYFTTESQIHLDKEAVNMLAQLSAWNVISLEEQLSTLLAESDPP